MKANTYKVNWPMRLAALMACLVLLTTSMLSGFYAKYVSRATADDASRVAVFRVNQQLLNSGAAVQHINFELLPSERSKSWTIQVINESETAVRYTLTLQNETGNLPVTAWLDNQTLATFGGRDLGPGLLGTGSQWQHQLSFGFDLDENSENSFLYHREIDHLILTLHCEQIN